MNCVAANPPHGRCTRSMGRFFDGHRVQASSIKLKSLHFEDLNQVSAG
jgi:hypothetical protein